MLLVVDRWRYAMVLVLLVSALEMRAGHGVGQQLVLARQEASPQPDLCSVLPVPATPPAHAHEAVGAPEQPSTVDESAHNEPLASAAPNGSLAAQPIPFDMVFIDTMIVGHEGTTVMAELATLRAEHPELIAFSRAVVAEQVAAGDKLRAWREEWYPGTPQAFALHSTALMDEAAMLAGAPADGGLGMSPIVMDPATDLRVLCAAQPPFDLAFIDQLIVRKRTEITMGGLALQRAEHPELAEFSKVMIETQMREIDQMTAWRWAR